MGVEPPFLYDAVSYREFDPRAASRKSYQSSIARTAPRPKQEGPLVSFNQHPDSYLILPYGNTSVTPMNPSVKTWVKWMRVVLLVTRILEFVAACGLLVMMILINKVEDVSGWIMRIVPAIVILDTIYAIYHLSRKASGRTAASSAFYLTFVALVDVSILPFYAYGALVAHTRSSAWETILSNQNLAPIFTQTVFLTAIAAGGLHVLSIAVAIYLALTFRKITSMPPDMNPLEDNLTSRHKRSSKSSISTTTTDPSIKRLSTPLEANRSSGVPYEDLSRPPTIPFFHTRTQSTTSFSTYKDTEVPGSSDGSILSSNRQYQPVPNLASPRSSMIEQKHSSFNAHPHLPPPKRATYQEVPLSDHNSPTFQNFSRGGASPTKEWYTSDSLTKSSRPRTPGNNTSPSPTNKYAPLHQRHDSDIDLSSFTPHPNPLDSNPSTPTPPRHSHRYNLSRDSPLSEIHNTNINTSSSNRNSRRISGDITNLNLTSELLSSHQNLQAQTQQHQQQQPIHPYRQPPTVSSTHSKYFDADDVSAVSLSTYSDDETEDSPSTQLTRELTPAPLRPVSVISNSSIGVTKESLANAYIIAPPTRTARDPIVSAYVTNINARTKVGGETSPDQKSRYGDASDSSELNMKSKYYGKLKPGTPPIMVGSSVGGGEGGRQVSGNDYAYAAKNVRGREVSGKVAEEGRGFGARFRKVSGM